MLEHYMARIGTFGRENTIYFWRFAGQRMVNVRLHYHGVGRGWGGTYQESLSAYGAVDLLDYVGKAWGIVPGSLRPASYSWATRSATVDSEWWVTPAEIADALKAGESISIMVPDSSDPCGGRMVERRVSACYPADVPLGDGREGWTRGRFQMWFDSLDFVAGLITYPPTRYQVVARWNHVAVSDRV